MTRQSLTSCVGLGVLFAALCTGCVILPMDVHTSVSRTNVREETTLTIIPGRTTKEEIFLDLGEPDEISLDGSRLVYTWTKVKLIFGDVLHLGRAYKDYSLIITFDEHGVVVHREFQGQPLRVF